MFDSAEKGDARAVAAWLDEGGGVSVKPRATAPNTPDTAEARAAEIQGKRDAEMATKFSETGGIEASYGRRC